MYRKLNNFFNKNKIPLIISYFNSSPSFSRVHKHALKSLTCSRSLVPLRIQHTPMFVIGGILSFLGLQEEKQEEDKESELVTVIKRSILCIHREEYAKAEQMLHVALRLAQQLQNEDGVTYIYDVMANLAYDTGDMKKAEKLFVTVMKRLAEKGIELNDDKMIHISLKLSKIYEAAGDKSKAEEGYRFCTENLKQKVEMEGIRSEDTVMLWAMSLDYYAHFLLMQNRFKEAFDCFKKAYETCLHYHGRYFDQAVVLLNDMGTVANLLGNVDDALRYFEEAVKAGEKSPDVEDLATVYVNMGKTYLLKSMVQEAEHSCKIAKSLSQKIDDPEASREAEECIEMVRDALSG